MHILRTKARYACGNTLMVVLAVVALTCLLELLTPSRALAEPEDSDYQSGTIPILRFTISDDIDPETGDVILTADEKIQLMHESPKHEYKVTGVTADLIVPVDYDNPEDDLWDGAGGYAGETGLSLEYLRGRGNSTWRASKKPYKFKLDEKADLFGMGSNKHWTLIANYYDTSLTIDRLVAWLGEQMGLPYTPRGVPVDLYMNDEYYGSYLLMEEVRVDKSRVDIDEVSGKASDPSSLDITGDYLFGMNRKPTAVESEYFTTSRGSSFSWEAPEYEPPLTEAEEAQQAYLQAHLDRVEDAIYAKDFTNGRGDYVWDLIDRESLAGYWWIQEFTGNRDGFATPSTYLYKKRDQANTDGTVTVGKLYWGPLWDFDFVWGEFDAEGFDNTEATWVSLLRQDPEFVELFKERWQVLDATLEEVTKPDGLLDAYIDEMSQSWKANQQRWPKEDQYGWADGSYQESIEELRTHIEARREWINAHLDQLQTAYYTVTFMDGENEVLSVTGRAGSMIRADAPEPAEPEGMIFKGWFTEDGKEYNPDDHFEADCTYRARYIDASTAIAATDIFFAQDEVWTQYGVGLKYDLLPLNAEDTRIVWSSSDESIATVNADGYVSFNPDCLNEADTAEVTITALLVGSGNSASIRVITYDGDAITPPEPESITFEDAIEVEVDGYYQLRPTVEPRPSKLNEYRDLSFEVEDEGIAAVTNTGVVVGKASGTTRVTVQRPNPETYETETIATILVNVVENEPAPVLFDIVFKLGGGTINGSSEDLHLRCSDGEVITIPDAPVRDGYTFQYWKGSEYRPGDTYKVVGDHTFTAEWKRDATPDKGETLPKTGDTFFSTGSLLAIALLAVASGLRMRSDR